jgi:hypothetical protein
VYKVLVRKCEGKTLLVRPRNRWECNISRELKKIKREVEDRGPEDMVMRFWLP